MRKILHLNICELQEAFLYKIAVFGGIRDWLSSWLHDLPNKKKIIYHFIYIDN